VNRVRIALLLLSLSVLACGCGPGERVVSANGARLRVPGGWERVRPAATPVDDPRTLLAVASGGVRAKPSRCTQAAYRIPPDEAVVIVIGWSSVAAAGGAPEPGREPLRRLTAVRRPSFECFDGRGAAADLLLHGKRYQVGVLVGDRASKRRVRQALGVARSFEPVG
jgi:hypothetical protein